MESFVARMTAKFEGDAVETTKEDGTFTDRLDFWALRNKTQICERCSGGSSQTVIDSKLLMFAAREGNFDTVKWLLDHGVRPDIRNKKGRNALLAAACSNRLDVFKLLLPVCDHYQVDDNGWNALHIAVVTRNIKIVKEAVKHIDIDSRSGSGLTGLGLASNDGHLEISRYLLQEGADPTLTCMKGWSPLHFAARASRPHHAEILKLLLASGKCGEVLNMKTEDGQTPLLIAVRSGNLESVKELLDCGADINIKDTKGWSPTRIAAIHNYKQISQYLSNYNPSV